MPPASSSFTPLNVANDAVPEWMGSFTLVARPNTDLWRKPPSRDTSTAPILYTALRNPFVAAEVTVSADWELEWDQGGLVIFAGAPPGHIATSELDPPNVANISLDDTSTTASPLSSQGLSSPNLSAPQTPIASAQPTSVTSHRQDRGPPPAYVPPPTPTSKWVKVGLEFCNSACHATSVVANSEGADWSLSALSPNQSRRFDLRVKMERIGYALWLWYEDEQLGWRKLREVTWFFWGVEDKAVRVGVYASRPANFAVGSLWANSGANNTGSGDDGDDGGGIGARNLCVGFEGLEIF